MNTRDKLVAARTALILDQPFFGELSLRLKLVEDNSCETAWVDGKHLGYNPKFIDDLNHHEITALVAHEVMHCACGHPWRKDAREHERWNQACDYAINPVLTQAGFQLPEGGLNNPAFAGLSAEWIYDRLPQGQGASQKAQGKGQAGKGAPGPGKPQPGAQGAGRTPGAPNPQGEVRDAPSGAQEAAEGSTEADWQIATQQAARTANARGKLPAGLLRLVQEAVAPKVDWHSLLRRFVQQCAQADYDRRQPSRRYLARGLYMPSLRSEELGPVVIGYDTSGSVDNVLLGQFAAELRSIFSELDPRRVHVMYCDASAHCETFERGDELIIKPRGGGGTSFVPVFDAVQQLDEAPACVVYLTDLDGAFPDQAPTVPTLWATPNTKVAPFGETVRIQ